MMVLDLVFIFPVSSSVICGIVLTCTSLGLDLLLVDRMVSLLAETAKLSVTPSPRINANFSSQPVSKLYANNLFLIPKTHKIRSM